MRWIGLDWVGLSWVCRDGGFHDLWVSCRVPCSIRWALLQVVMYAEGAETRYTNQLFVFAVVYMLVLFIFAFFSTSRGFLFS